MKTSAKNRISSAALLAASCGFIASPALSQVTDEVSAQRFDPAPGKDNFITTRAARMDGKMTWTAAFMANYGYKPLSVKLCETSPCREEPDPTVRTIPVVENMVTGDLYGSLVVIPMLQVGLKLPISWSKGQGITADGEPVDGGISQAGLGDMQLEGKARFYGEADSKFVLGGSLYGTVPFGDLTAKGAYIGSSTAAIGANLIGDFRFDALTFGANAGFLYRGEAQIGPGTTLGPEIRWGVAAGYQVSPIIRVVGDMFGNLSVSDFSGLGAHAIEIDAAGQITPLGSPISINLGGGAGVLKGVGIPDARVFVGVVYGGAEVRDRDADNILDNDDQCPDNPEDVDGNEDSDGCPDLDNDSDGIPDSADKCPSKPEDVDNFEDKDGCPEDDNDKDGVPDLQDQCPAEPETKNGVEDLDGCPDVKDTDKDGLIDEKDKCVNEAEDTDGFQDEDGCPDPDNDGDGIPDSTDECIDQAEDKKGKGAQKEDGCPIDA